MVWYYFNRIRYNFVPLTFHKYIEEISNVTFYFYNYFLQFLSNINLFFNTYL